MSPEDPPKLISSRRAARVAVIQALYQMTIGGVRGREALQDVLEREAYSPETTKFIESTLQGVVNGVDSIDAMIQRFLQKGWEMDRIAVTDKCVLRLAVYELLEIPEMPPNVTISEAVVLAKRFGSPESARFVNGLLGQLVKETAKQNWNPADHPRFEPEPEPEPEDPEPEEETVEEGTPEHDDLIKAGGWTVRVSGESP